MGILWLLSFIEAAFCMAAGPSAEIPTPKQFGFREDVSTDEHGRTVITYKKPSSDRLLKLTYSPAFAMESIEETSIGGRIYERQEFQRDYTVKEVFSPTHIRTEYRTTTIPQVNEPLTQVTTTYWKGSEQTTTVYYLKEREALAYEACPSPKSNSTDLNSIAKTSCATAAQVDATDNPRLGGCERYPRGGASALKTNFNQGMEKGFSCLFKIGNRSERNALKIGAMLGNINRPLSLLCGVPGEKVTTQCHPGKPGEAELCRDVIIRETAEAQAFEQSSPHFPGFYVNIESDLIKKKAPDEISSAMFHEMLHLIGYVHFEGIDYAYLSEQCCFNDDNPAHANRKDLACDLLKKASSLDWKGEEYQYSFAQLMDEAFRPSVAQRAAWSSFLSAANHDPIGLFGFAMGVNAAGSKFEAERWKNFGNPVSGIIFGTAAISHMRPSQANGYVKKLKRLVSDKYYPVTSPETALKRALFETYGTALGALGTGQETEFLKKWDEFQTLTKSACSTLSESEKAQLQSAAATTYLQVLRLLKDPFTAVRVYKVWEKPCS